MLKMPSLINVSQEKQLRERERNNKNWRLDVNGEFYLLKGVTLRIPSEGNGNHKGHAAAITWWNILYGAHVIYTLVSIFFIQFKQKAGVQESRKKGRMSKKDTSHQQFCSRRCVAFVVELAASLGSARSVCLGRRGSRTEQVQHRRLACVVGEWLWCWMDCMDLPRALTWSSHQVKEIRHKNIRAKRKRERERQTERMHWRMSTDCETSSY